jgi:hypothetical protein
MLAPQRTGVTSYPLRKNNALRDGTSVLLSVHAATVLMDILGQLHHEPLIWSEI